MDENDNIKYDERKKNKFRWEWINRTDHLDGKKNTFGVKQFKKQDIAFSYSMVILLNMIVTVLRDYINIPVQLFMKKRGKQCNILRL